jgi:hypothetical protein
VLAVTESSGVVSLETKYNRKPPIITAILVMDLHEEEKKPHITK